MPESSASTVMAGALDGSGSVPCVLLTMTTVQVAVCETRFGMLARRNFFRPLIPALPTTTTSTALSAAARDDRGGRIVVDHDDGAALVPGDLGDVALELRGRVADPLGPRAPERPVVGCDHAHEQQLGPVAPGERRRPPDGARRRRRAIGSHEHPLDHGRQHTGPARGRPSPARAPWETFSARKRLVGNHVRVENAGVEPRGRAPWTSELISR